MRLSIVTATATVMASLKVALPGWSAATMQMPAARPVTALPLVLPPRAQLIGVKFVKTIGNPELAVAVQTMESPIEMIDGAHDRLTMVWSSLIWITAIVFVTGAAGL